LLSGCQLSDFLIRGRAESGCNLWSCKCSSNNISQSLVTRFGNNNKPDKELWASGWLMADGSLLLATGFWLRGDRQRGQGRSGIIELLALSLHLHLHAAQSLSSPSSISSCLFSHITKCNALIYLTCPLEKTQTHCSCQLSVCCFVCLFSGSKCT